MKKLLLLFLSIGILSGCDDDPDPIVKETPIEITIQHLWNTSPLALNAWYTTTEG
ncbi:MAG: hypothetical protein ACI9UJ_002295, partial [bacterium]